MINKKNLLPPVTTFINRLKIELTSRCIFSGCMIEIGTYASRRFLNKPQMTNDRPLEAGGGSNTLPTNRIILNVIPHPFIRI